MTNYINVAVPEHLVPEVYRLISGHMTAKETPPSREPEPTPVAISSALPSSDWSEAELLKLWNDSWPPMRKVLSVLAANGGVSVSGEELAKALDKAKKGHTIAGMMGAIGRRLKHRHQSRWPFSKGWNAAAYRWEYTMPTPIAEVISKIASSEKDDKK